MTFFFSIYNNIYRPFVQPCYFFNVSQNKNFRIVLWVNDSKNNYYYRKIKKFAEVKEFDFESEIRKQVELAFDEADIIIFVVDVEDGITPMDTEVANILRKVKKPIFTVVNKVDNAMRDAESVINFFPEGYHFDKCAMENDFAGGCFDHDQKQISLNTYVS